MFKYTIKSSIKHRAKDYMRVCKPKLYDFFMHDLSSDKRDSLVFVFDTEVKEIEINGYMFPVNLFDVEELQ